MEIAERVQVPVGHLTDFLANLEAQPTAIREAVLRRFIEAWLVHQREAYEAEHHGGENDESPRR